MKAVSRTLPFFCCLLLLLLSLPADAKTLNFGRLKAPALRVETITAVYDNAKNALVLKAALNYDLSKLASGQDYSLQWQIEGPANGFALVDLADNFQKVLTLGTDGQSVVVKACVTHGSRTGGCRTLTVKAEKVQACIDEALWRQIPEQEWDDLICTGVTNDEYQYVFYKVRSTVNTLTGKYNRSDVDLRVKVPGGTLTVKRSYADDRWHWEHEKDNLSFEYNDQAELKTIKKGRVIYQRSQKDRLLFTHGTYRIMRNDDGFWWEDKRGNFKSFDTTGRVTLFGNRSGVIGRYLYEEKEGGNLVAIEDRYRRRVMKLRYLHGHLESIEDAERRRVRYRYLDGRLQSFTSLANQKTLYAYNTEGRLAAITDPGDHKTVITYDANGRVASVTDAKGEGHQFKFRYDRKRRLYYVRTESTAGRVREVWHTKNGEAREVKINGQVVKKIERHGRELIITGPGGHKTIKVFDKNENLLRVTYPDGTEIQNEYHPKFNRKTHSINEAGIVTLFAYDKKGRLIKQVEAAGMPEQRTTGYAWDKEGNRTLVKQPGNAETAETVTKMAYDASGNMTASTDAEGHTTRFTYDYRGNILTRTDPTGAKWTHTYDLAGNRVKTVDPLGQVTKFRYDALGNRIAVIDPAGNRTMFTYDDNRRLTEKIDAFDGRTRFEYNSDGKMTRQTDAEDKQTQYEYDTAGRLSATIDGAGNRIVTEYADEASAPCPTCGNAGTDKPLRVRYPTFTREFAYDLRGRKIIHKDLVDGKELRVSRFKYDAAGNLIEKTDPMGKATRYAYDGLKRLVKTTDPMGGETAYTYDSRDNLIALTDAMGNTTRFAYDRNNRMVKETRPMGQATAYRYGSTGNLMEKTDPRGIRATYQYDLLARVISTRYFSSDATEQPVKTVNFTYDALGNITSYEDGTSSAAYKYDQLNRKTEETVNYGKFSLTYKYEYYKNGMKKSYTSPGKKTYAYTYDEANRLKSLFIPGQGDITWDTYKWNQPGQITLPGGTTREIAYDPMMQIKLILAKTKQEDVIQVYSYKYDTAGNILSKATEHGTYDYRYDDLYQLTGAKNPQSDDELFTYDKVGNRLEDAKTEGRWQYNPNNELLKSGTTAFKYDAAGNTIEKSDEETLIRYIYNAENRLEKINDTAGSIIAHYYYDPFGRRLYKEVDGKRTYFLYTDEGLSGEYTQKGKAIKSYGYKPNATWTTDPLFQKVDLKYYYYHNDHLGTPQKLTDKKGRVVWGAVYFAFGKIFNNPINNTDNKLQFPGQYNDIETDLVYNYFRYYDPTLGRYLRNDPIGTQLGLNNYSYSSCAPVSAMDHLGLFPNKIYEEIDRAWFSAQSNDVQRSILVAYKLRSSSTHNTPYLNIGQSLSEDILKDNGCPDEYKDICRVNCVLFGVAVITAKTGKDLTINVVQNILGYKKIKDTQIAAIFISTMAGFTNTGISRFTSAEKDAKFYSDIISKCVRECDN